MNPRTHDFWKNGNCPEDCRKAISELKRLKVYGLCGFDYEETFSDVWWLVLHEVDLYEEGEFCREASRCVWGEGDPEAMNLKQAQAADRWLCRWVDLFNKYKGDECHTEYWRSINSPYGDGDFAYDGQLI